MNVNLWWGIVMVVFGAVMLALAKCGASQARRRGLSQLRASSVSASKRWAWARSKVT